MPEKRLLTPKNRFSPPEEEKKLKFLLTFPLKSLCKTTRQWVLVVNRQCRELIACWGKVDVLCSTPVCLFVGCSASIPEEGVTIYAHNLHAHLLARHISVQHIRCVLLLNFVCSNTVHALNGLSVFSVERQFLGHF